MDARIRLLHVAELQTVAIPEMPADMFDEEETQALATAKALIQDMGLDADRIDIEVTSANLYRPPARVIQEVALRMGVRMIVMGTHGRRGLRRLLMGSVTEEVVRHAASPVMVVPLSKKAMSKAPVSRLFVPLDFSEHTDVVMEEAGIMARVFGAKVDLFHAVDMPYLPYVGLANDPLKDIQKRALKAAGEELEQLAATLHEGGLEVEVHKRTGPAGSTILEAARDNDADFIVMASHGRHGLDRILLGSVTEKVLRGAACPVLVVRIPPES
jgi:nucleotide-binding universal stress UspA family protein